MAKTGIVLCSFMLILSASAQIYEFDNNFIEYGPAPSISLPYPYQEYQVVEPSPPVYKKHHAPEVIVSAPVATEVVEVVEPTGFISTAISCTFNAIKSAIVFLLANMPGLLAGGAVALGFCKLTSLCDNQVTIYEAQSELRSLASSERLSRAANFVKEAIKKYGDMQKS